MPTNIEETYERLRNGFQIEMEDSAATSFQVLATGLSLVPLQGLSIYMDIVPADSAHGVPNLIFRITIGDQVNGVLFETARSISDINLKSFRAIAIEHLNVTSDTLSRASYIHVAVSARPGRDVFWASSEHESFLQKLITGEYKYAEDRYRACGNLDTKTKTIRCKCLMCDGEWDADLYDLRKHYGCPHCSKKDKVIFARQYLLEAAYAIYGKGSVAVKPPFFDKKLSGADFTIKQTRLSVSVKHGSTNIYKQIPRTHEGFARCNEELVTVISPIKDSASVPAVASGRIIAVKEDLGKPDNFPLLRQLTEELYGSPLTDAQHNACICNAFKASVKRSPARFLRDLKTRNQCFANGEFSVVGEYMRDDYPIECRCTICGHVWSPKPQSLLQGASCPNAKNHPAPGQESLF